MKATRKEEDAIFECYKRLYKQSTPSADFNLLMEKAEINEQGQKVIDFMAYEIDESVFNSIIDDIIKEYKIVPKYKQQAFKNTMCLGASPKFKSK